MYTHLLQCFLFIKSLVLLGMVELFIRSARLGSWLGSARLGRPGTPLPARLCLAWGGGGGRGRGGLGEGWEEEEPFLARHIQLVAKEKINVDTLILSWVCVVKNTFFV